jgi:hypothetical protein
MKFLCYRCGREWERLEGNEPGPCPGCGRPEGSWKGEIEVPEHLARTLYQRWMEAQDKEGPMPFEAFLDGEYKRACTGEGE